MADIDPSKGYDWIKKNYDPEVAETLFNYLFTYMSYLEVLSKQSFSRHKCTCWAYFCALKGGLTLSDPEKRRQYGEAFPANQTNLAIFYETIGRNEKKQRTLNDVISDFEKEYVTMDGSDTEKGQESFLMTEVIKKYGVHKGNVFLSAYCTSNVYALTNCKEANYDKIKAVCDLSVNSEIEVSYGYETCNQYKEFLSYYTSDRIRALSLLDQIISQSNLYVDEKFMKFTDETVRHMGLKA